MLDTQLRTQIRPVADKLARPLVRLLPTLTPDKLTWAGLGCGALACLFAMYNYTLAALIFIALNRLADALDGALARVKSETDLFYRHVEPRGKFLDIVCDHLFFAAYPFALAIGLDREGAYFSSALLMFSLVALGSSSLAYGLMVAGNTAVAPQKFQISNLAESVEMIVYIILITLLPALFVWLTVPFALFCLASAMGRMRQAYTAVT